MVNEITNSIAANIPGPVTGSGHSEQSGAVNAPEATGEALPAEGETQPTQQAPDTPVSKTELRQAVNQINTIVQTVHRDLHFSLDEDNGHTVIRVEDSESGELVRQIPSEEVLAIATQLREMGEMMDSNQENVPSGLLFSDRT